MKILQVLPSLTAGGAEGFITHLVISLRQLGADVHVHTLGGVRGDRGRFLLQRLEEAGITVTGIPERYPGSLRNLLELAGLLRILRPDVVHANLYTSEVACVAARFLVPWQKTAYVRRLAGTDLIEHRSPTMVRVLDRFFPDVVACSDAVAVAYRALMGRSQRGRLTTIPNGGALLDSPPDEGTRQAARRRFGIARDAFVVAHIGRFIGGGDVKDGGLETGYKAQDVLLKAFAAAFKGHPDCVLILAGDGPLRPEAESLADALEVGGQVHFLGQQPEPWDTLKAADMLCFPSRNEGLPNVLIEAASAGLPVVASDIPEIRDLCPEDDCWRLAPVDDVEAFVRALGQMRAELPAFRARTHIATAEFRDRFCMEVCARRYLALYQKATGVPLPDVEGAGTAE